MRWNLEQRKIQEVLPNENNPRKLSKRQKEDLKNSIEKFGLCQPIVLNTDGTVIGGHQRLSILERLGYTHVDVYLPSDALSAQEEKELSIRLNKNVGDWDYDKLANSWEPEELLDWGFTMEEFSLESIPFKEGAPKRFTIKISCRDQDQLEMIENRISHLVNDFPGANYKVKVK